MAPLLSLQSVRRPENYEMCECVHFIHSFFFARKILKGRLDFVHILEMQAAHVVKGHRHILVPPLVSNSDPSYFALKTYLSTLAPLDIIIAK